MNPINKIILMILLMKRMSFQLECYANTVEFLKFKTFRFLNEIPH